MAEPVERIEGESEEPLSTLSVKRGVTARALTTFGIGGNVEKFLEVQSIAELREAIAAARAAGLSWRMIGAGSNVVFRDSGISGLVLRLGRALSSYVVADGEVTFEQWIGNCQEHPPERAAKTIALAPSPGETFSVFALAATPLMTFSRQLSALGLSGLEFAAGIPASLGGAIVMNAGAHGHEMAEVIRRVAVLRNDAAVDIREASQLAFSYRHSQLEPGEVVLGAEFLLRADSPETIRERRTACLEYRKKTQPLSMPSAGSAFRNPSRQSSAEDKISLPAAAELLESAGLKGHSIGGVAYSQLHANWLVRISEQARTEELEALIDLGIEKVRDAFGISLRPEIILW